MAAALLLSCAVSEAQIRVLTIGDSITDEYEAIADLDNILTIGSVYPEPDDPNPYNNPRAFNWPELLELRRSTEVDFGIDSTWGGLDFVDIFGIKFPGGDLRYEGFQYNFAVVSLTTADWVNIILNNTSGYEAPLPLFLGNTRDSLISTLPAVDVAVILLGGNDLKNDYFSIFNTGPPEALFTDIHDRLETIHTFVRTLRPNMPIIVATVPDVGATPNVFETYNTPGVQAATRAKIAGMNQNIITTFSNNPAKPNTGVARVDNLTSDILDIILGVVPGPFNLNGTELTIDGDPYNPSDHIFCKDDFHPNTAGQLLLANEVIAAINEFFPTTPITPFSNREILEILLLDPDQPYLDWVGPFSLSDDGPYDDPDRDGLTNLIEMILGTSPSTFSSPFTGTWPDGISWTPVDESYAELVAEESPDLSGWTPVPAERISTSGAEHTATPPGGADSYFLRFGANPRP